MDQLEPHYTYPAVLWLRRGTPRTSALAHYYSLPGSRPAYANWQKILVAVAGLCETSSTFAAIFGAIAPV